MPLKTLLVWAQLLGLFSAGHCAMASPLSRVDFGGMVTVGASRHLDNLQPLAAVTDDDTLRTVAAVNEFRQRGVQFVDCGLIQGVDIHGGWGVWASLRPAQLTETTGLRLAPPSLGCIYGPCRSKGLRGDVFTFRRPDSEASGRAVIWLRWPDSNRRPRGYEPPALPLRHTAFEFVAPLPTHCQAESGRQANGGLSKGFSCPS